LKLVDFDIHDEMKDKLLKFTDSYDAWMNRHELQQFSEEFSAI
jgi:methylglyoxal synthase